MDKKYLDGGRFQVLPMALGIILGAPLGLALIRWLGLKLTELPVMVAGSICGALVVIVSWLFVVLVGQASAKKWSAGIFSSHYFDCQCRRPPAHIIQHHLALKPTAQAVTAPNINQARASGTAVKTPDIA